MGTKVVEPKNPSAFPVVFALPAGSNGLAGELLKAPQQHIYTGMTLRDYFAAKAMQSIIANSVVLQMQKNAAKAAGTSLESEISDWSFKMADAMLAERVK